jgi:AraC-like DNA-binding protein
MAAVIRRLVPVNGSVLSGAQGVHGTAVHWTPPGRTMPDIFAAVPSIHAVWHGSQPLYFDGRCLKLEDEVFLVLDAGHTLSSRGRRESGASLLSIYFAPELLLSALHALPAEEQELLSPSLQSGTLALLEHLRERDKSIASVMNYVAHHVRSGVDDPRWYEEQVGFLLRRLLANEIALVRRIGGMTRAKAWKRRETFVRLARVTDLIHCAYQNPLTITDLAQAAHWSPYHMMREFKELHGISPYEFLQRRRTQAAASLLCSTELPVAEIAERVGFNERSTLLRRLRRSRGLGARALRVLAHESAQSAQSGPRRMTTVAASRVNDATSIPSVT